jgi:serine/threonine protein kinase/WD40 repeat protein/tetratricopeptide (TPR) repeat protein
MTSRVPASALATPCDPAFDLLVDELIARLQAGEAPDWQALGREHPEYVGRLRSMAQALEALGDLSRADGSALVPAKPSLALRAQLGDLSRAGGSAPSGVGLPAGAEEAVPGVLGDFRIVREVGRGGMGVVYEAEQVSLNRRVALKVLPFAATMDPRQLERFRHEARAAALLHHAHIVPVHGVGCERGVHYYAMQLIEGCSLAAVIDELRAAGNKGDWAGNKGDCPLEERGTVPFVAGNAAPTRPLAALSTIPLRRGRAYYRRVAELVAQAAEALEYAHAMGVVHRDVKPANLLLDAAGNVWVTDFGLARLGEGLGLTISGDLVGTLRYMSPEQALARHGLVDHRTDIYSLGATLYELLTLRPAMDGVSKQEVLHRLAFAEPVAPRKLDRSVPAELETVTLKAVAKNPLERYSTAQELADDLRRWLDDRPTLARPPSVLQRLRKWSMRHRPLVLGLGVFLTLLAAGLGLGAVGYGIHQREMAKEWSQFAEEKERAAGKIAADLRQVLAGRAEAVRVARQPGYRRRVWADLREAINIRGGGGSTDTLRATLLACLGDPVGLDPVGDLAAVRRREAPRLPAESGKWVKQASNGGPMAVSPDGNRIATVGRGWQVAVRNREGKQLQEESCPLGGIYDLAFSADRKVLVAGCEQGFVAWDLPGPERWVVRAGVVTSVAVSPNGRLLACGGRQLELWSLATRRPVASLPAPVAGARVEFSADGRILLAVVKGTAVAGWPVSDTPERRVLDGHTGGVPAVVFSPDGRQLVSVAKDRTVRVWDAATGQPLRTLTGHAGMIEAAAFSPDGSLLATGDRAGAIRVWSAGSGDLLGEIGSGQPLNQVWRLQFGPAGEYLAAAGERLAIWTVRAAPGRVALERLCTLATNLAKPGAIDLVASPGGTELIHLDRGGQLVAYDLTRADENRLIGHARAVLHSLHFTLAGDRLSFVTPGGTLGLLDWKSVSKWGRDSWVLGVASPVWNTKATDTHRRAESVAVSSDGRWAAIAGAGQNVTIVELVSGREVLALPPEGSDVWCLTWAPDGSKLAVGLSDGIVAVWDLEQVQARLAEFGFDAPRTARAEGTRPPVPVPAFDRVVLVNRLRDEAERARRLAAAAQDAGDHAAERDQLLAALELYQRLAETVPDVPGHRQRVAWTHTTLARPLARLGNTRDALAHLDAAAKLLNRLTLDDPGNAQYRRNRAYEEGMRRFVLDLAGRRAEAIEAARQAVAVRKELAADPGTPSDRSQLVAASHNLAIVLFKAGRKAEAEQWFNAARVAGDQVAHDHPAEAADLLFRENRGATFHYLGVLRRQGGDLAGAVKQFRKAAALRTRLADDFPRSAEYASDAGLSLDWLGGCMWHLGQLEESARQYREATRRQRAALDLRPTDRKIRGLWRRHQNLRATLLLRLGRHADAAAAARELPPLADGGPAELLRAARLLAGCVALAERDSGPPWRASPFLAWAYRDEALALIRAAVAKGPGEATRILSHPDFEPVRDCTEFRRLQGGLVRKK